MLESEVPRFLTFCMSEPGIDNISIRIGMVPIPGIPSGKILGIGIGVILVQIPVLVSDWYV